MALNDPRTIPYDFRVVRIGYWCWLFDNSERQYPCTATPHIYMEALYPCPLDPDVDDGGDWGRPEPGLFQAVYIETLDSVSLEMDLGPEIDRQEAWDDAREEANGNCRI